MQRKGMAILVSGGLDSVALVGDKSTRHQAIYPIYIRQNLRWETVELYWLRRFLRAVKKQKNIQPLTVLTLPMDDVYGAHWSNRQARVPGARTPDQAVYLPGRNPTLTVKAAIFCALQKIPELALGSLQHNPFPDATPHFFKCWSNALSEALARSVRIVAPFRALTKEQVIRRTQQWPLHLSFSCLSPRGKSHCGQCNKCAERRKAFQQDHVKDLTTYAKN